VFLSQALEWEVH